MAKDVFDTPPMGMSRRGKRGWLKVRGLRRGLTGMKVSSEKDILMEEAPTGGPTELFLKDTGDRDCARAPEG